MHNTTATKKLCQPGRKLGSIPEITPLASTRHVCVCPHIKECTSPYHHCQQQQKPTNQTNTKTLGSAASSSGYHLEYLLLSTCLVLGTHTLPTLTVHPNRMFIILRVGLLKVKGQEYFLLLFMPLLPPA